MVTGGPEEGIFYDKPVAPAARVLGAFSIRVSLASIMGRGSSEFHQIERVMLQSLASHRTKGECLL